MIRRQTFIWLCLLIFAALSTMITVEAAELSNLPATIDRVKPAMVAIGIFQKTRRQFFAAQVL